MARVVRKVSNKSAKSQKKGLDKKQKTIIGSIVGGVIVVVAVVLTIVLIVVNNNTKQIKISFTSHTIGILEEIKNYFNNGNIYLTQNGNYSLEFSTFSSLNILQKFYDLNTPCLLRKYNKYLNALNIRNNIPRDKNSSVEDEKLC